MSPFGGIVRGGMIVQPSRGSLLLCVDFESSLLILLPDVSSPLSAPAATMMGSVVIATESKLEHLVNIVCYYDYSKR